MYGFSKSHTGVCVPSLENAGASVRPHLPALPACTWVNGDVGLRTIRP